jgi:hypothetical protein
MRHHLSPAQAETGLIIASLPLKKSAQSPKSFLPLTPPLQKLAIMGSCASAPLAAATKEASADDLKAVPSAMSEGFSAPMVMSYVLKTCCFSFVLPGFHVLEPGCWLLVR